MNYLDALGNVGGYIAVIRIVCSTIVLPFAYVDYNIALAEEYYSDSHSKNKVDADCFTYLNIIYNTFRFFTSCNWENNHVPIEKEKPYVEDGVIKNVDCLGKISFDHAFSIERLMNTHTKVHLID